ncbi:MAG: hypothetical protein OXU61_06005 [Gammaproteobacteria bacterium]|nr:hypothetical protein [Gammaproteobacteria bacterium]
MINGQEPEYGKLYPVMLAYRSKKEYPTANGGERREAPPSPAGAATAILRRSPGGGRRGDAIMGRKTRRLCAMRVVAGLPEPYLNRAAGKGRRPPYCL